MTAAENPVNGITVLYVEDESEARRLLSTVLGHRYPHLRIVMAEDGESGLALFAQDHPEIVITDINMPGLDGLTMAARIRTLRPNTEIVALTAHSDTPYLLQAIELGITHYILKPVDFERVFAALDKALDRIRLEREIVKQNDLIRTLNVELGQKAAELKVANQDLESFNYSVAHDLRSPMVVIGGFAQLLLERHAAVLDKPCKEYLQVIYSQIQHLDHMITALLKFTGHTRKSLEKEWTDLSSLANEIKCNLMLQEPRRQVTFTVAEGVRGYSDPALVRIVLENLLANAWKYSAKNDTARIEFGVHEHEDELVYFVRDNGAGFAQEEASRLFKPFQRLKCNREVEGFGIGLATAHRIIQRHGGRIWAEGEQGRGATFFFTL